MDVQLSRNRSATSGGAEFLRAEMMDAQNQQLHQ
jgi:hypothetical protein